ncbi:MAG: hypothetical protein WCP97_07845 [bacterium]
MPSVVIGQSVKNQPHYVTFTVKNWYYLFDRYNRFSILEDSFYYCQKHKQLKIFAYVFMLNHVHFIGSASDLSAVIRDMKTFLSKELQRNIIATEPSLCKLFTDDQGKFSLWQPTNYPKIITEDNFLLQKINYIHMNPVRKMYVHSPEDWAWSSACRISGKIKITGLDDF